MEALNIRGMGVLPKWFLLRKIMVHLCSFWGYLIFRQTPNDPGHVKAQMNPGWRSCGTFLFLGEGSFWMAFQKMVATLRCFNLLNVYQSVSMLNRPRAADMYQSSRWGIVPGKILWKPQMSQWIFIETGPPSVSKVATCIMCWTCWQLSVPSPPPLSLDIFCRTWVGCLRWVREVPKFHHGTAVAFSFHCCI